MCAILQAIIIMSFYRYAYEEKDVVVLRKEFPNSPFHWLD